MMTTDGPGNGVMPKDVVLPANVAPLYDRQHPARSRGSVSTLPVACASSRRTRSVGRLTFARRHCARRLGYSWRGRRRKAGMRGSATAPLVRSMPQASQGFRDSGRHLHRVVQTVDVLDKSVLPNMPIARKVVHHPGAQGRADGNDTRASARSTCRSHCDVYRMGVAAVHRCCQRRLRPAGQYTPVRGDKGRTAGEG